MMVTCGKTTNGIYLRFERRLTGPVDKNLNGKSPHQKLELGAFHSDAR